MRRQLLSILFLVASALATIAAALTAQAGPVDVDENLESAPYLGQLSAVPERATGATVDIRSGLLADQPLPVSDSSGAVSPVAIRIRAISLATTVISVGVDAENRFDVPAADTVGWYKYSSSPGTAGATVLAAHVDYGGDAGAFYNLRQLRVGDVVEVEMSDGRILSFSVTNNTLYDKTKLPANELFRKDGESTLQLITCGGTFDPQAHSYEANLVVSAKPIST